MLRSRTFVTGKTTEVLQTKRHHRNIDFTYSKPSFITFIEILKLRTILYKTEKGKLQVQRNIYWKLFKSSLT